MFDTVAQHGVTGMVFGWWCGEQSNIEETSFDVAPAGAWAKTPLHGWNMTSQAKFLHCSSGVIYCMWLFLVLQVGWCGVTRHLLLRHLQTMDVRAIHPE